MVGYQSLHRSNRSRKSEFKSSRNRMFRKGRNIRIEKKELIASEANV